MHMHRTLMSQGEDVTIIPKIKLNIVTEPQTIKHEVAQITSESEIDGMEQHAQMEVNRTTANR